MAGLSDRVRGIPRHHAGQAMDKSVTLKARQPIVHGLYGHMWRDINQHAPVKAHNPIWHGLFCPVNDAVSDTVLQNVLDKIAEDLL